MASIGSKTGSMVIEKITAVVLVVVIRFFVESKVVGHLFFQKKFRLVDRFAVFFVLGENVEQTFFKLRSCFF